MASALNITFPGNLAKVASAAALRGVPATFISDDAAYLVDDLGIFDWNPSSLANDDGRSVIKPNGFTPLQAGRWIYSGIAGVGQDDLDASVASFAVVGGAGKVGYQPPVEGALPETVASAFNNLRLHSGSFVIAANSNGTTDNRAALQAMIDAGDCEFLARTYAISDELVVPVGRKITIQPGARFVWLGDSPDRANSKAFFRVGSNVQIAVNSSSGGRAFFECPSPMSFVYTVIGFGVTDVRVSGLNHYQCSGTYFDSALGSFVDRYADVVTPKMVGAAKPGGGSYAEADVNVSRKIRVSSCDGRMAAFAATGVGVLVRYTDDIIISQCVHENLYAGVQWEGGNASFAAQGADPNAYRKVSNITVVDCISRNVECGYWGAFGDMILCDGVQVYTAHDVALDSEGCWNVTYRNFKVRDGFNGGLAMFWFNRNIVFENGSVEVTNKIYPLARVYNSSLLAANNTDVTFTGIVFTCLDPSGIGVIDTGAGPVRSFNMRGCTLVNARLDVSGSNQVDIQITARFTIKAAAVFNVVSVRDTQGGGNFAPPMATISGCAIYSEVAQPAGSVGYYAISGDPNSTADHIITNNKMRLPLDDSTQGGIRVVSAGRGSFAAAFTVRGNLVEGPIASATSQGPAGIFDIQQNYTARGGVPVMG